jgi:catechol 2,3-dioxygenase-like lactoylglutathione lyase family enzyme
VTASAARPTQGIDHVVIAVRDLDRGEAQFRRLGFALTPRGHHTTLGSYNHCAMFAHEYLELIALGTKSRPALERFLSVREGIAGIALRTGDAQRTYGELRERGVTAAEPIAFGRPVEAEGRKGEARFATTEVETTATAGVRVFYCQHDTPELVWLPPYLAQPNGVERLAGLVIVDDGAGFTGLLDRIPGSPSTQAEFLTSAKAAQRFAGDPILKTASPYVAAVRFGVADREATARCLEASGVPVRRLADGALQVSSRDAMGAVLEFI